MSRDRSLSATKSNETRNKILVENKDSGMRYFLYHSYKGNQVTKLIVLKCPVNYCISLVFLIEKYFLILLDFELFGCLQCSF